MVYVNNKPILLVCDNTVFIKQLDAMKDKMEGTDAGFPYGSAKEHYILDIENLQLAREIVSILEEITPIPMPKKKKTTK